jgi:hypothetical protein
MNDQIQAWAVERCKELKMVYNAASQANAEIRQRLFKSYSAYQNKPVSDRPWLSKENIPHVYNTIRQTYARVLGAWEMADNHIVVRPAGFEPYQPQVNQDAEVKALLLQNVSEMNYKLGENQKAVSDAILDTLIAGWGILKSGYRVVKEKTMVGELPAYVPKQEFAELVRVSPFNFMIDPGATTVHNARWTFEILEVSREMAAMEIAKGRWRPDAMDKIQWLSGANIPVEMKERLKYTRMGRKGTGDLYGYGTVIEAWSWEDPLGHGVPNLWAFWFDEMTGEILGAQENYYTHGERPYSIGVSTPAPDSVYGIGMAEMLFPIWEKASTVLAQIEENIAAQNLRHLVRRSGGVDEEALRKSIPNGIIFTEEMDAWRPIQATPIPNDFWQMLSFYDGKVQETSAVTPIVMAMRAASTAYATSVLQGQSDAAFDITISNICRTLLTPAFRQFVKNIQQFMDLPIQVPVHFGSAVSPPVQVSPNDIEGDFYVEAATVRSEQSMKAQAAAMGSLLNQMLQLGVPANYPWLIIQIYQRLGLPEAHKAFEGELFAPQGNAGPAPPPGEPATQPGQNAPAQEGGLMAPQQMGAPPQGARLAMTRGVMGNLPQDVSGSYTGG